MKTMHVYMMTNKKYGTLYTGVSSRLAVRAWQHKYGYFRGFTSKYRLYRVVYYEVIYGKREAIAREKQIKGYRRQKKINLIKLMNPEWKDLLN